MNYYTVLGIDKKSNSKKNKKGLQKNGHEISSG